MLPQRKLSRQVGSTISTKLRDIGQIVKLPLTLPCKMAPYTCCLCGAKIKCMRPGFRCKTCRTKNPA